jgi:hypothetical protein
MTQNLSKRANIIYTIASVLKSWHRILTNEPILACYNVANIGSYVKILCHDFNTLAIM